MPARGRERLDLLHAERDLIVIDKPAGLLTMPSAPGRGEHEDSVLARAREYARHKRGRQAYVGLLHRLDRGTSGALAVALSHDVHAEGRLLFKAHRFERTYLALVSGVPEPREGTIDRPISADYRDGRRAVAEGTTEALPARTHYRVRERFGTTAALVELTLDTGGSIRSASTSPRSAIRCWTTASTARRARARSGRTGRCCMPGAWRFHIR